VNSFEASLVNCLGEENLKKIQGVKIGIAGAGGLGSNCAFNLVRSGFKNFLLADFDLVDYSNLNRQFYFCHQVGKKKVEALSLNLLAINPDLHLELFSGKIATDNAGELFQACDVVVEAFDQACCKRMIVEEYLNSGKLLVSASGLAGWGNSDQIGVHKMKEKFYLIGDLVSEVSENLPPISPRVNIAAAKQADVILNYVLNAGNKGVRE